jgi:hypothetical protein
MEGEVSTIENTSPVPIAATMALEMIEADNSAISHAGERS